ncbi:hypothetical protein GJ496_002723 [Pomphorhynchus laevis]|nr:hypothetical protein GJ496_002723 [Pomphorhynchus laevis]
MMQNYPKLISFVSKRDINEISHVLNYRSTQIHRMQDIHHDSNALGSKYYNKYHIHNQINDTTRYDPHRDYIENFLSKFEQHGR